MAKSNRDYEFRAPGSPQATGNEWHQPLLPAFVAAMALFAACVTIVLAVDALGQLMEAL